MLKIDLHMHSAEDPKDAGIRHDARQLIDRAAQLGFDAIAITLHSKVHFNAELGRYARSRGVLLIPGCEARIEGKDVLLYNVTETERRCLKTFDDLRRLRAKRGDSMLVIAPHPYFPTYIACGRQLEAHPGLFDAIELSQYYYPLVFNHNKKAEAVAKRFGKPTVCTSDAHSLRFFGRHFTFVDATPSITDIFAALRAGKVIGVSRPLRTLQFATLCLHITSYGFRKFAKLPAKNAF